MKSLKWQLAETEAESARLKEEIRQERRDAYAKLREREREKIEGLKHELADAFGLKRDAKFDKAFSIAWEHGHSEGFEEVHAIFSELVELLKL